MIQLKVNDVPRSFDGEPDMPLLWYLRDVLALTGTKFGCGMALCGACTVHQNGKAIRSCVTTMQRAAGSDIRTIEYLGVNGLHPVQKAMVEELSPQCGFCTSGQVVSAVALLKHNPKPTVDEARLAMSGNLCRCGAYDHYLKAVMRASREA